MSESKEGTRGWAFIKNSLIIISIVLIVIITSVGTTLALARDVTIIDGDKAFSVSTRQSTVGDLLIENKITLAKEDIISLSLDSKLDNNSVIRINRAINVKVVCDKNEINLKTTAETASELLKNEGIMLNELDDINCPLYALLEDGQNIVIHRVVERIETINEEIPFDTENRENSSLDKGVTQLAQQGEVGTKELSYKIVTKDGEEISREQVSEQIIKTPVNEIIDVGTKVALPPQEDPSVPASTTNISSKKFSYRKVVTMTATAYDNSYESNGVRPGQPGYGKGASGMTLKRGVVAVDPRVIPLRTNLYIESLDGFPDYGYAVAGDTGGAIKGNKIDLFFPTAREMNAFGKRKVRVYILN